MSAVCENGCFLQLCAGPRQHRLGQLLSRCRQQVASNEYRFSRWCLGFSRGSTHSKALRSFCATSQQLVTRHRQDHCRLSFTDKDNLHSIQSGSFHRSGRFVRFPKDQRLDANCKVVDDSPCSSSPSNVAPQSSSDFHCDSCVDVVFSEVCFSAPDLRAAGQVPRLD